MKSKIVLLCIASLVLQEVCAQNLESIDIPVTQKYGEEDMNKMINEFTQTGSCSLYDFCIDYSDVDTRIEKLRTDSYEFLSKALSKC